MRSLYCKAARKAGLGELHRCAFISILALLAGNAQACEPAVPLVIIFSGNVGIARSLLPSVFWLGGAIAIKCVAFACFERRLHFLQRLAAMLLGNVTSSIVGIITAAMFAVPSATLYVLPVIGLLALLPAKRVEKYSEMLLGRRVGGKTWAVTLVLGAMLSQLLFAMGFLVGMAPTISYWLVKLAYLLPAILLSIVSSTLWEEWTISSVLGKRGVDQCYVSAFRANAVTLIFLMIAAAVEILPRRLDETGFIGQILSFSHQA